MNVSFGSKLRLRTFGCVAIASTVFIFRSTLSMYYVGSGVQVVLSGFNVRLLCFVQAKSCTGVQKKSFAHIKCYSDCSRRGSHLVELLSYGGWSGGRIMA